MNSCLWTDTTKEFVQKLELKPGQKVLDVGCGIGGGDFYMAENFNVDVVGIDLSINMVSFALERAIGLNCSVEFEVADCTKKTYPENSFDVIYSRDTILHIQVRRLFFLLFYFILFLEGGSCSLNSYKRCLFILLFILFLIFNGQCGSIIYTVWNLNVCWLIFRTNLHYSDPSTSGWSLEVKFLSVITARMLELHLWNLLNILSKEDMISMMLNHMARYVAFKICLISRLARIFSWPFLFISLT